MAEGHFKDHQDVRLMLLYSETLAHLIYAAADVVLVRCSHNGNHGALY